MKDQEGLSYNERSILSIIIGEKKSLKMLLEMTELGLKLLNFPSKNDAKIFYDSLEIRPKYSRYIIEDILSLDW